MLIRSAEVEGGARRDVRVADGRIAAIAAELAARPGESLVDADGGALLPGLHDHHLHLFALAAAAGSVRCGPPQVRDRADLERALREAGGHGWLRGVGYHESVAGELDRRALDAWLPVRPLRVQHRSGALWVINSAGVDRLGLDAGVDAEGVERDAAGRATGRLFRLDAWLRRRLGPAPEPDLAATGLRLAAFGVTGATDATLDNAQPACAALVSAVADGRIPQRLLLMGRPELPEPDHPRVARGAVKFVLNDAALPAFAQLRHDIAEAHRGGRTVAVHCVTRAELVLAVAALDAAGARPGDRIEHAAVAPPELLEPLAGLALTVVTQHNFLHERGDAYARDVAAGDLPWLYRGRGFLTAGVPLGGGTDAPFGDPDPWRAMRAAVERRSEQGRVLAPEEALTPERALALFTTPAAAPGGLPRRLVPGAPADLCLLDAPWSEVRHDLSSRHVRATWREGEEIWRRE